MIVAAIFMWLSIALVILAFLSGYAMAGQYKPNELCMTAPVLEGPYHEVPCSVDMYGELRISNEDPCIANMEAAMRAMEPFSVLDLDPSWSQINLSKLTIHNGGSVTLPNEEDDYPKLTPYGLTQTMNARAGLAIVLWESVKRECWKAKP